MDKYVIDASVLIKWYIDEENSNNAIKIRNEYIDGKVDLFVPNLIFYEVLNAVKYKKKLSKEQLNTIAESLENYDFKIFELIGSIREKAIQYAIDYQLSIYDASYFSIAILNNIVLITADEKIKKKIPNALKKNILNLNEVKI